MRPYQGPGSIADRGFVITRAQVTDMASAPPRNTVTRDAHRRTIARTKPPCGICSEPIDYKLRYPHPDCYVVDHIHPRAKGGPDTLDNKQAAHNHCNRAKSDKLDGPDTRTPTRTFITTRTW